MKKVASIELLRFISAFMVLVWHYQQFYLPYNPFSNYEIISSNRSIQPFYEFLNIFYNFGNKGVDFFFIISGFVFAHVYLSKYSKTTLKTFFVNRLARLYPLHLLTLLVVLLLQTYSNNNFQIFLIYNFNDIYHFFLNLFFISGWGLENGPSYNGPVWSVSIEIIIYFLFFYLIISFKNFRFLKSVVLVISLISIRKILSEEYLIYLPKYLLTCAILFFEGVIVYYIVVKLKNKLTLFGLGTFLFILSLIGNFKIFIFLPSIIIIFLSLEKMITKKIGSIFCFLGNLTYGTYLWHVPIQIFIIIFLKKFNIGTVIFQSKGFFLSYMMLVFVFSLISFIFFEKKMRIFIREFFKKYQQN